MESRERSYLVVANRTLGGDHLLEKVRECLAAGPCRFHLVVPATPPGDHLWTEAEARAVAAERLESALVRFREVGAQADGEVGDANPMLAIEDVLLQQPFDEIILSTLPPGPSKWLRLDLPHRVRQHFRLPLTHLVAERTPQHH